MRHLAIMLANVVLFLGISAAAQESRSEISLQGTGLFTKDSTGLGTTERSTNRGGFLVGYRYNFNRWLGVKRFTAMAETPNNFFRPPAYRGFRPTFTRQLADSWSGYRLLRDSDSARMCWLREAHWYLIQPATLLEASPVRNVRRLVCLCTAAAQTFPLSNTSHCAPSIVVWSTARLTLGWRH
jgi:hypothetical protein